MKYVPLANFIGLAILFFYLARQSESLLWGFIFFMLFGIFLFCAIMTGAELAFNNKGDFYPSEDDEVTPDQKEQLKKWRF